MVEAGQCQNQQARECGFPVLHLPLRCPQLGGRFSRASREGFVAFIWGVVFLNKVTDVDFILPVTFRKTFRAVANFSLSSDM